MHLRLVTEASTLDRIANIALRRCSVNSPYGPGIRTRDKTTSISKRRIPMETNPLTFFGRTRFYFSRVLANDSTKRGVAAAGAGFLMSLILEAAWPTQRVN